MPRPPYSSARRRAGISPELPAFKFSDADWAQIAPHMGDDPNKYRGALEQIARRLIYARQNPESFWWYRPPKSDLVGVKKMAIAATKILCEFDQLSGYAAGEMQAAFAAAAEMRIRDNKLRANIEHLANLTAFFAQNGFGFKFREGPHHDDTRNRAWAHATLLWEHANGRRATVSVKSQAYEHTEPYGRFVLFLTAFTKAIGEPEPTGHAIREWYRKYWGEKDSWHIDMATD